MDAAGLTTLLRAYTTQMLQDATLVYLFFGVAALVGVALSAVAGLRPEWARKGTPLARAATNFARALPVFGLMICTFLVVAAEALADGWITAALGLDFTAHVVALEGNAVERFQDALHGSWAGPHLDRYFVLVYTWGVFLLYLGPFYHLVLAGHHASANRLGRTLAGIWGIGLVFYVLFPVNEVWYAAPAFGQQVDNLLFAAVPETATSPTYLMSINNNFPSLHTAASAGIAFSLYYAAERRWIAPAAWLAGSIIVSTMYLGIHWVADVVSGITLAWAVAWIVHVRSPRPEPGPAGQPNPSSALATARSAATGLRAAARKALDGTSQRISRFGGRKP